MQTPASSPAAVLQRALRDAGVAVVGVSIGKRNDRTTWRVYPEALQLDAQPIIESRSAEQWQRDANLAGLRAERNQRLRDSDWTQMADVPMSGADKAAWIAYRRALRDLPQTVVDPTNPVWPTPPPQS
jgi:hypothetical protein